MESSFYPHDKAKKNSRKRIESQSVIDDVISESMFQSKPLDTSFIRIETRHLKQMYCNMSIQGEGTVAIVYKATRKHDEVVVALKELDFDRIKANTTMQWAEFLQEARQEIHIQVMLQSVKEQQLNCAIVPVYEFFRPPQGASNKIYIEMKLIEGINVRTLIAQKQRLDFKWDVDVLYMNFVRLCKTMSHLHSLCILHRDIKPENLLFDTNTSLMYLCDFGNACIEPNFTPCHGTECYLDPLVSLWRVKNPNQYSDIYSFGITFLELMTRKNIWHLAQTETDFETLEEIINANKAGIKIITCKMKAYKADPDHYTGDIAKLETMLSLIKQMIRETKPRPNFTQIVQELLQE